MYGTLIGISALLVGVFTMNLGFGLQATLLGVRAGVEGFAVPITGAIMAMYYAGYVVGTTLNPRLVQRIGHVRVFAALASVASTAALLHAVFVLPVTWILLRVMTGFCVAGLLIVTESWLNHSSTNRTRGSVLSIYMVMSLGATALAQLLLNVAPIDGMDLFILVSVLVSLSLLPIVLTTRTMPELKPTPRMPMRKLFAFSPMGTVGCFTTGLTNGAFWGMGAVYAHALGLSTRDISLFMAFAVLGGMLSQLPLGRLSDRIDRRLVLVGLAVAMTLSSLGLALAGPQSHEVLFVLGFLFGAAVFPLYAISIAHVNDMTKIDDFVPVSSALLQIYALGAVVGPFAASFAMYAAGPPGMFFYTAAISALLGIFTVHRLLVGRTVQHADKDEFIAVPRTTDQAYEMASQVVEDASNTNS